MLQEHEAGARARSSHRLDFFASWIADPFSVASIVPSGRMLARLMAVGLGSDDVVVELGAGTGTLTAELLDAGVREENLYLIEQNRRFAAILESRFPRVRTICTDASRVAEALPGLAGRVDGVVSGLPILWFERDKKIRIVSAVFELLRTGGFLQQFTYLVRPPIGSALREELGLTASLVGLAPVNLPPAFVYRFSRA